LPDESHHSPGQTTKRGAYIAAVLQIFSYLYSYCFFVVINITPFLALAP
jgi:hypothetical protein